MYKFRMQGKGGSLGNHFNRYENNLKFDILRVSMPRGG